MLVLILTTEKYLYFPERNGSMPKIQLRKQWIATFYLSNFVNKKCKQLGD